MFRSFRKNDRIKVTECRCAAPDPFDGSGNLSLLQMICVGCIVSDIRNLFPDDQFVPHGILCYPAPEQSAISPVPLMRRRSLCMPAITEWTSAFPVLTHSPFLRKRGSSSNAKMQDHSRPDHCQDSPCFTLFLSFCVVFTPVVFQFNTLLPVFLHLSPL